MSYLGSARRLYDFVWFPIFVASSSVATSEGQYKGFQAFGFWNLGSMDA